MTLPGHHASAPHVHRILSDPVLLPGPFPHDRAMVLAFSDRSSESCGRPARTRGTRMTARPSRSVQRRPVGLEPRMGVVVSNPCHVVERFTAVQSVARGCGADPPTRLRTACRAGRRRARATTAMTACPTPPTHGSRMRPLQVRSKERQGSPSPPWSRADSTRRELHEAGGTIRRMLCRCAARRGEPAPRPQPPLAG
jgi:hypothetical protein